MEFLLKSAYVDEDWDRVEQVRVSALMKVVEGLDEKMLMALRSKIDDVQAFTKARSDYLEGREGETLPPRLYGSIPYVRFGDLSYPKGFKANFTVSELGFISHLEIPEDLDQKARERFFEVLGQLRFFPRVKEGNPTWSRAVMDIK